jgi:hypothetical protein
MPPDADSGAELGSDDKFLDNGEEPGASPRRRRKFSFPLAVVLL